MPRGAGQAKPPELPETSGVIEELGPSVIRMRSEAGGELMLQATPTTRVIVSGPATEEFLSTGQWISFVGEVDKRRGAVTEPVSKLTIFTPTNKIPPGAYPDQGFAPGLGPAAKEEKTLAGADDGPSGGTRRGARRAEPKSGDKSPAVTVQSFEIHGQITSIKNGKLTLQVPTQYFRPTLRAELAETPQIDVMMVGGATLCVFAQKGDKIKATGQRVAENRALAGLLEIALSQPLGAAQSKKRPVARGDRTTRSSRAATADRSEGADDDEPEKKIVKPRSTPSKRLSKKAAAEDETPSSEEAEK